MKKCISSKNAPLLGLPLSPATVKNGIVFVSGQIGVDPATGKLREGFEGQVRQTLENIIALVKEAGGKVDDIVKVQVYLTDINKFEEFNSIYREYFNENPPARSTFEVSNLADPYIFEAEAIAILD